MSKKEPQYFTLESKRILNFLIDADRSMRMFATTVKALGDKYEPENWYSTSIPDYMDGFLNAKVLKDFIEKQLKQPSKLAVDYMKAHNFDGLFLTKDELQMLYTLIHNFEESKDYISKTYGVSTMLN